MVYDPRKSKGVITFGTVLIVIAFLWGYLVSGNPFKGLVAYKNVDRVRNVLVVNGEGEAFVGQVTSHGDLKLDGEEQPEISVPKGSYVSDDSDGFSFQRDVLGIYGRIDWGKIIRVVMYVVGILLLLASNIKRPK